LRDGRAVALEGVFVRNRLDPQSPNGVRIARFCYAFYVDGLLFGICLHDFLEPATMMTGTGLSIE
jgi:hypothetical protein